MTKTICESCERELTEYDSIAITDDGTPYCERCESDCWQTPNIVCEFSPEGKTQYNWCAEFGFRDLEDWEQVSPDAVTGFEWETTNGGHRGHYDPILSKDYTIIADGWMTGDYDDVRHKHLYNRFCDKMASQEWSELLPCNFTITIGTTSNVFSRTSAVIVRKSDEAALREFLSNIGYPVYKLQQALS